MASYFLGPVSFNKRVQPSSIYDSAAQLWAALLIAGRQETVSWQSAALGSIIISALLGTALAISIGRASALTYVVELEPLRQVATANSEPLLEGTVPTAGFPPDHPETNMSSLSIDLVTLRERWLASYDFFYVDDRGPETSNDYAGARGSRQKRIGPGHHRKPHVWRRHGSRWPKP